MRLTDLKCYRVTLQGTTQTSKGTQREPLRHPQEPTRIACGGLLMMSWCNGKAKGLNVTGGDTGGLPSRRQKKAPKGIPRRLIVYYLLCLIVGGS